MLDWSTFQVLGIQAVKGGQKRSENKGGMRRKHIIPNALSFHLGSVVVVFYTKYIQDHPSWLLGKGSQSQQ